MLCRFRVCLLLSISLIIPRIKVDGQSIPVPRDHAGLELLRKADTSLTHGLQLKDGILTGQYSAVFELMGNKTAFSGNIEAKFLGEDYSAAHFEPHTFMALPTTEMCTLDSNGEIISVKITGSHTAGDNSQNITMSHAPDPKAFTNCWSAPDWLFPATLVRSAIDNPEYAVVYQGKVTEGARKYDVIRIYRSKPGTQAIFWQGITVHEVFLDSQTLLPSVLRFWTSEHHPGKTPIQSAVPSRTITIHYSNYRKADDFLVPFNVERSDLEGVITTTSIQVQNARFNIGISAAQFALSGK